MAIMQYVTGRYGPTPLALKPATDGSPTICSS